jgi:PKD repeat protein
MKQHKLLGLMAIISLLLAAGSAQADEGCTIAVAAGSVTTDGRPLLWKNRDTDDLDQEVRYFNDGSHGGYIAIVSTGVDETTTAYVGVNDDGFAIMNANAPDLSTGSPTSHGILMKRALRECGSVADFEMLLITTSGGRGHIWANFGVIDRFGNAAIFETNDWDYRKYDADSEGGFVVRTNFSFWGGSPPGSRYERAYQLISDAVDSGQFDHRYLVQTVSKDIGGPPSMPCGEWPTTDPAISRYRTRSAAVVHGVLPNEDPRLSTFWCTLGEPSCGVSVPLWSYAGSPPPEMFMPGQQAPMCAEIQEKELYCYSDLVNDTTIDTNELVGDDGSSGIQGYSIPIEIEAFDETAAMLDAWRVVFPPASEIALFQSERANRTYVYFDMEVAPGTRPVAAFSGEPTWGYLPLTVTFSDESIGAESWQWAFGDSSTSTLQHPIHTYDMAGSFTVSLTVSNADGSDNETKINYITVTDPDAVTESYALGDLPGAGVVTGSYLDTRASDNGYQVLTEVLNTDHPHKTYSYLEHKWWFGVVGGTEVTFRIEAYRPANEDSDNFHIDYSTDDQNYTNLLTVASDVEQEYAAALPPNTNGTVFVRVQDTVRSWGTNSLDTIYIDRLVIEITGAEPRPPTAAFSANPTSGFVPLTVGFTDESGNLPSAWAWDFGDGEGSTQQNPSHTYWAAATYTVTLTATNDYGSDTLTKLNYITVTEPTGTTMHVQDIDVSRRVTGPNHRGVGVITIYDSDDMPIADATVYATATGPVGG